LVKIIKHGRAFSLIELLVTVSIVAIITVVGIPAYLQYSNKAKVSTIITALESVAKQATAYRSQTGSWPTSMYGVAVNNQSAYTTVPNVTTLYYGSNTKNVWIGFKTDTTKIPSGSNGWIFYVVRIINDAYSTVCGQWQPPSTAFDFGNTAILPAGCNETNVASLRVS